PRSTLFPYTTLFRSRLQQAVGTALPRARNLVEVEQDLGAVDQVTQERLGDAGATLSRDGLLQLLELFFHQMMDGLARALQRPVAGAAHDQVDGVEAALRRFPLMRAQVIGQA